MNTDHNKVADRLAKKFKTRHRHEGVDIVTKGKAIEVAVTKKDLYQSIGQLNRSRAAKKYMAVPASLISEAKNLLKSSSIGIMNTKGRIRKRSRKT